MDLRDRGKPLQAPMAAHLSQNMWKLEISQVHRAGHCSIEAARPRKSSVDEPAADSRDQLATFCRMDIEDTAAVAQAINKAATGDRTWKTHTYVIDRRSPVHGMQEVHVTIRDGGKGADPRYHVEAKTDDGQHGCSGNSGNKLDVVISTVHWQDLDK